MDKKKISITQILRHIIQIAAFIISPGLFILTLSAIESVYKAIITASFSLSVLAIPLIVLVAVIPITVLWGRFFCGWLCAFGSMQELIGFIGNKLKIRKIKISPEADRILKWLKYAVLLALFVIWSIDADVSKLSPWNIFGIYSSYKGWSDLSSMFTLGGAILLIIIIFSLFFERGFCRYFCPLGGVYNAISLPRIFKIKKNNKCVGCQKCSATCPMGIDICGEVNKYGKVKSGECIDCFKCVDGCGFNALYTNPKEAVSGTVAAIAISGIYLAGTALATGNSTVQNTPSSSVSQGQYTDGTYTGTAQGYRGNITVSVTVENGNISSITIESYNDDEEFFSRAKSEIINSIINKQSTDVDIVSGATFSSRGIINAVSNALGLTESSSDDYFTDNSNEEEFNNFSYDDDYDEEDENITENNSASSAFENLKDGTYSGTGSGRNGDINVSVTVENGKVASITVTSSNEDYEYMSRAQNTVIAEIIDAQSVDVKTVSGATMSSNGIIDAVANALGIVFENPNGSIQFEHGGGHHGGPH